MTTEFGIARLPPVILVSCNNATNACQFDVNGPTICQRGRLCKATSEIADPCLPSRLQLVKFKNKSQALYLIPIQATVYEFWTSGRKHTTGQTHSNFWHPADYVKQFRQVSRAMGVSLSPEEFRLSSSFWLTANDIGCTGLDVIVAATTVNLCHLHYLSLVCSDCSKCSQAKKPLATNTVSSPRLGGHKRHVRFAVSRVRGEKAFVTTQKCGVSCWQQGQAFPSPPLSTEIMFCPYSFPFSSILYCLPLLSRH